MYAEIDSHNKESQSNGSLMRIAPLPFLGSLMMHPGRGYKSSAVLEAWGQLVKGTPAATQTRSD